VIPRDLFDEPNALWPDYSRFGVRDRLLLTGHSHQAWPDAALAGQTRAWHDAAELADLKWGPAFEVAEFVRGRWASLLDDPDGDITLGQNTHELITRFLSALDLRARPRIVTSDGEFHSIRRQLERLAEEGIEVVRVPVASAADAPDTSPSTLAERLAAEVDDRTAAVLVSSVLFESARIVPNLRAVGEACALHGAELLVDTYHHLNAVPFSVRAEGLQGAFLVGGGYKYCQLGEGNCFLRVPAGNRMRPVYTGWFSEFGTLASANVDEVVYGEGADRFAGSTYDPTSHYRAQAVFEFFHTRGLRPEFLREVSQHQVGLLIEHFDALDLDPIVISRDRDIDLAHLAGFVALTSDRAGELQVALRELGVLTDSRQNVLRFGPAPYLSDAQLRRAMDALGEAVGLLG
jgi:kynureninase